jgi:rod shape-determining protein MreC
MRKAEIKKITLTLFLLLLVLTLFYQLRDFLKNFAYFIFSPFQRFFLKLQKDIFLFFETVSEIKSLKKENENLKSEIKKLIVEKESLKELEKENRTLREALSLGLEKEFKLKMTRFLGKDAAQDVFLIDKGKEEGIEEGKVVILPEKVLVGKIMKVYPNFSKVKVFTFKDFSFDVEIGEEKFVALAKGQGNFKAKIELIPKEKEIFPGQMVFTSALGGNFPKGILVGEIKEVKDSDIFGYQEAILEPAFQLKNLNYLFVILNF